MHNSEAGERSPYHLGNAGLRNCVLRIGDVTISMVISLPETDLELH